MRTVKSEMDKVSIHPTKIPFYWRFRLNLAYDSVWETDKTHSQIMCNMTIG
jgi:hypothetical protein